MKKFAFALIAISMAMSVACSMAGCNSNDAAADQLSDALTPDTAKYTALSDTVEQLSATIIGNSILEQLDYWKANYDSTYNIDHFVDGLGIVLDKRHKAEFINGTAAGLTMAAELAQIEKTAKKTVDRKKVMASLRTAFALDSTTYQAQDNARDRLIKLAGALDSVTPTPATLDSLAQAYGTAAGYILGADRNAFVKAEGRPINNAIFLEGLETVISQPRDDEFLAGVNQALKINQNSSQIETLGINLHRENLLKLISDIIRSGKKADKETLDDVNARYQQIIDKRLKAKNEAEDARMAQSPEAVQNQLTGRALVDKMKKSEPRAVTTESGLTYVIYEPGNGDLITDGKVVHARYTGSHLDGKVFDTNQNGQLPVNSMIIPGLCEGLKLLRPGAKATFWIPGNLAYGGRGVPQVEIGPMETLVFDVTILSVE